MCETCAYCGPDGTTCTNPIPYWRIDHPEGDRGICTLWKDWRDKRKED